MNSVMQIKRGTDAERLAYIPRLGEMIWTIDTNALYVGNGITLGGLSPTNLGGGGASFDNSAELRALLSDPTGTGFAVFSMSPALSGTPTSTTPSPGDNGTRIATTAFVATSFATIASLSSYALVSSLSSYALISSLSSYALLASPTFTGTPNVPTASLGTNTTQAASCAFVQAAVNTIAPATSTITYATSVTPNLSNGNIFEISSITGALAIGAPTGTPVNGQRIMFRLTFGAGASLPTWNAAYSFSEFDGAAADVVYTNGAINRIMFMYSTLTSKWELAGMLPVL